MKSWRQARELTLNRITNYLFTLNTGGLFAALTYISAKGDNTDITFSINLFCAGIFFTVLYAAIDYHLMEHGLNSFVKDVKQLLGNQLDWEKLIKRNDSQINKYNVLLRFIGWLSAIVFFFGLFIGVSQLT